MNKKHKPNKKQKKNSYKAPFLIMLMLTTIILIVLGSYMLFISIRENGKDITDISDEVVQVWKDNNKDLQKAKQEAAALQESLRKEREERKNFIAQAMQLTLGYDYDGAIERIKSYQGKEGGYKVYIELTEAIKRLEDEKASLKLYGGSYYSAAEINHIFFHTLVADNAKAFDEDSDALGYNKYMTTISEFEKIINKLYEDGYVLVRMSDLVKKEVQQDGSIKYIPNEIYLREGKKPLVLSEDDVSYYDYMMDDGFASRIVLDENNKPVCERKQEDGTTVTGAFDIIPILNEFIEQHPDFSYKGAKGLLALTGYEGILGYRTNDPASPTYEKDLQDAKKVVEALKADGWEFGSHGWGHKNMQEASFGLVKQDTDRWLKEVGSIVGSTDIYVFPFGIDIEAGVGAYTSEKYKYLEKNGFQLFLGVYKEPWMQIKKDYVRMARRAIDGQAMLEFPDRLVDLFDAEDILDPMRPPKNW